MDVCLVGTYVPFFVYLYIIDYVKRLVSVFMEVSARRKIPGFPEKDPKL